MKAGKETNSFMKLIKFHHCKSLLCVGGKEDLEDIQLLTKLDALLF